MAELVDTLKELAAVASAAAGKVPDMRDHLSCMGSCLQKDPVQDIPWTLRVAERLAVGAPRLGFGIVASWQGLGLRSRPLGCNRAASAPLSLGSKYEVLQMELPPGQAKPLLPWRMGYLLEAPPLS